jgi:muramoyltetrapeptide carboxypeptidase
VACRTLWSAFYGPLATWTDARTGPDSIESLRKALMTTDPIILTRDPAEPSAAVNIRGNASGIATGPLIGGNLTIVETGLGTGDFPSLEGAIFLFEDTGEAPYSYDRMLTQLLRSGALDEIAGVANRTVRLGEWRCGRVDGGTGRFPTAARTSVCRCSAV